MDTTKPVQSTDAPRPSSPRSIGRFCSNLTFLFAVTFAAAWWLTPIEPYATLNLDDKCGLRCFFSPDGTRFVTSVSQGSIWSKGPLQIWDVEQGRKQISVARNWENSHDWPQGSIVQFSPDSRLLAAHETEGDIKLWNAQTGKEVASLSPGTKFANWINFRFSPDGRFLVFQDYSKGEVDPKSWTAKGPAKERVGERNAVVWVWGSSGLHADCTS